MANLARDHDEQARCKWKLVGLAPAAVDRERLAGLPIGRCISPFDKNGGSPVATCKAGARNSASGSVAGGLASARCLMLSVIWLDKEAGYSKCRDKSGRRGEKRTEAANGEARHWKLQAQPTRSPIGRRDWLLVDVPCTSMYLQMSRKWISCDSVTWVPDAERPSRRLQRAGLFYYLLKYINAKTGNVNRTVAVVGQ